MKKIVVSIFVAALGSHAAAQTIGNSPYAAYGIGDIKYDNSVETRSMGGISAAYVWDFNNQFNKIVKSNELPICKWSSNTFCIEHTHDNCS